MDLLNTKSIKITKKSPVHTISDLFFRAIEIIVVTIILSKICYELLHSNISLYFLLNRHLAFALGNAIVIALIAKSSVFKNQEVDPKNGFYEEFVRESSRSHQNSEYEAKQSKEENNEKKQSITENRVKQSISENRAKQSNFDDKEKKKTSKKIEKQSIISENRAKQCICKKQSICRKQSITYENRAKQSIDEEKNERSESYQRTKSEKHEGLKKKSMGRLMRSETNSGRYENDDELRSKIESFIARQRRNQVEEESCVSLD